jgi:ACR3 family arsenite efflux pump ArsB
LAVATAISLFGFHSGAALATVRTPSIRMPIPRGTSISRSA